MADDIIIEIGLYFIFFMIFLLGVVTFIFVFFVYDPTLDWVEEWRARAKASLEEDRAARRAQMAHDEAAKRAAAEAEQKKAARQSGKAQGPTVRLKRQNAKAKRSGS